MLDTATPASPLDALDAGFALLDDMMADRVHDLVFYLGTPEPSWLKRARNIRLFVSRRRLQRLVRLPRATTAWALDSGGFNEVTEHGGWSRITEHEYLEFVARCDVEIGGMEWAAPMDWMMEDAALAATGLTGREHQQRSVDNYLRLVELWPEFSDDTCPIVPVLQGDDRDGTTHTDCIDLYEAAGVDLTSPDLPLVGLGSVCRLESSDRIVELVESVAARLPDVGLHGFGVKARGLERIGHLLASADSQAWSKGARDRKIKLDGCTHAGPCSWCSRLALDWYAQVRTAAGYPTGGCEYFPEHGDPTWMPRTWAA